MNLRSAILHTNSNRSVAVDLKRSDYVDDVGVEEDIDIRWVASKQKETEFEESCRPLI